MTLRHCVAVDLGASSGRVMLARYDTLSRTIRLQEIHRFANGLVQQQGFDCWDMEMLEREIRHGLQLACDSGTPVDSIGIDSWGVDFVLIDKAGQRVGPAVAYRDDRTAGVMQLAQTQLGRETIYRRTGIQFLPFNSLYQLRALCHQQPERLDQVAHALLIPDYLSYRLTDQLNWEYTNATTTQLLDIHSGSWDETLLRWAGAPRRWFGTPAYPGQPIGVWACPTGRQIPVVAVASHDTASAVIAAPLADVHAAYLSSGTWSLIGFESKTPCTGDDALAANITNEGGAEGRYRVLKNIMGLWLLQRMLKEQAVGDLPGLIRQAQQLPACRSLIDPNDERFLNPPEMSAAIRLACRERNQPEPADAPALARCIFDSLALLYAGVLQQLTRLRDMPFTRLHIVGGGSQNHFLNQLCADACGIPVSTGPVEASTLGNIGCQLMALGAVPDVGSFRQVVSRSYPLQQFLPTPGSDIARFAAQYQHHRPLSKERCA